MSLKNQRRIAASLLKCSLHRVRFDPERLEEVKEGITKADIRGLIKDGAITERSEQGVSRGRSRQLRQKRRRGQGRGSGSRKGTRSARESKKRQWINHIRSQRRLISKLREQKSIDDSTFRHIYRRAKGGFFRNVRHIMLYLEENRLMKR